MAEASAGGGAPEDGKEQRSDGTEGFFGIVRWVGLVAGPLAFALLLWLEPPGGMEPMAWTMVAVTAWMAIWWLTEAIPVPATALLPLPLLPLTGILKIDPTAANYADDLIFLFLGGFMLAAAMQKTGLHRRIALGIVSVVGTTPRRIVLGFMLATAFLSMWISNTATTIMMFAVGLSVIDFVGRKTEDDTVIRNFGVALMLSIAYAASIGGVGTLIGTPPNALLASFVDKEYGIDLDFFTWMLFGVPVVLIMLPLTWLFLTKVLFPTGTLAVEDPKGVIRKETEALGSMGRAEMLVAIVFVCAALSWILRKPLSGWTGLPLNDAIIAIIAALVLFTVPVGRGKEATALDWETARDIPWGVLILFGGGLALAEGFNESGLASWIGNAVAGFEVSTIVLVGLVLVAIVYLTEITSNTATTATFLPILGAVAVGLELNALALCVPVALAASMAFMMPVATPPNAIVFSYERMTIFDMIRAGFLLNIMAIVIGFGLFALLGPFVFGVDLFG